MRRHERTLLKIAVLEILCGATAGDVVTPYRNALIRRFGKTVTEALPGAIARERDRLQAQAQRLLDKVKGSHGPTQ